MLPGRAREQLRMAGDIDRFAVDGGLEQILEFLKTKMGCRRPQEEGMAFKKVHLRDQTFERRVHDKLDQQI